MGDLSDIQEELERARDQQNFIDAYEYFFYPEKIKIQLFNKMKEIFPDNYSFLIGIKEKKRKFETPENAKLSFIY
tara:strand:+ start:433 stop:657 length:225 start_codon:yes stop_codon:yes gene_type:complete